MLFGGGGHCLGEGGIVWGLWASFGGRGCRLEAGGVVQGWLASFEGRGCHSEVVGSGCRLGVGDVVWGSGCRLEAGDVIWGWGELFVGGRCLCVVVIVGVSIGRHVTVVVVVEAVVTVVKCHI